MDQIPFDKELKTAWAHFKSEWKVYARPFLTFALGVNLISTIPGFGILAGLFIATPLGWIFYVAVYRHYNYFRDQSAGASLRTDDSAVLKNLAPVSLRNLIDQIDDEWRIIIMAFLARYVRILAAGFWTIFPAILKSGELVLVPQALAFDRARNWNANEWSESILEKDGEGWKIVQVCVVFFLSIAFIHIILKLILLNVIAFILNFVIDAAIAFYFVIFYYEIWKARDARTDSAPLIANSQSNEVEYWREIKDELPRALGTLLVLFFAIALIGVSGIETIIYFFH